MTDEPQDPPIPADVDLRDFSFTPMFRARLFGSSFHARANDAEWRAGVTLWLKSWDQVPAGSLPTDDVDLCRLAEFGRDIKGWKKVKARALHGWFECTDGRLYHWVVAEGVLEAHERRRTASSKGKAGALKRWSPSNGTSNATTITTGNALANATAIAQAMPNDSKGQGQGQGQGNPRVSVARPNSEGARFQKNGDVSGELGPDVQIAIELRKLGIAVNSIHPTVQAWVADGFTLSQVMDAAALARMRKPAPAKLGPNYLDTILRDETQRSVPSGASRQIKTADQIEDEAIDRGIAQGLTDQQIADELQVVPIDRIRRKREASHAQH